MKRCVNAAPGRVLSGSGLTQPSICLFPYRFSNLTESFPSCATKVDDVSIETGDARRVSPCVMCTCTKEGPLCQSLKIENCFHLAQSFRSVLIFPSNRLAKRKRSVPE